jgi:CheY-like chemotaxis protein
MAWKRHLLCLLSVCPSTGEAFLWHCSAVALGKRKGAIMTATQVADESNRVVASIGTEVASNSAGILSSALTRVRETAHSIEDRVRTLLTPDGPSIAELRILVVDDHPDSADSLVAVLEIVGCTARACYGGWSALDAIEEFDPQVCLLDLMMPDLGGLELGARLKVWAGDRPLLLIATTALADDQSRARTAIAGFHCHLIKPVDASTLLGAISRLWRVVVEQSDNFNPPTT